MTCRADSNETTYTHKILDFFCPRRNSREAEYFHIFYMKSLCPMYMRLWHFGLHTNQGITLSPASNETASGCIGRLFGVTLPFPDIGRYTYRTSPSTLTPVPSNRAMVSQIVQCQALDTSSSTEFWFLPRRVEVQRSEEYCAVRCCIVGPSWNGYHKGEQ